MPRVGTRVRHAAGSLYKPAVCLVCMQSSFGLRLVRMVYVFTVFSLRVFVAFISRAICAYVSAGLSFFLLDYRYRFRWITVYRRCSSGLACTRASFLAVITLSFTLP